jgi:hypothetical protein
MEKENAKRNFDWIEDETEVQRPAESSLRTKLAAKSSEALQLALQSYDELLLQQNEQARRFQKREQQWMEQLREWQEKFKSSTQDLNAQQQEYTEKLEKKLDEAQKLTEKLKSLEKEKSNLESNIYDLIRELDEQEEANARLDSELCIAKSHLGKSEITFKAFKEVAQSRFQQKDREWEQKLQQATQLTESLHKKNQELMTTVQAKEDEIEALFLRLAAQAKKNDGFEAKFQQMLQKNEELTRRNANLAAQVFLLEEERQKQVNQHKLEKEHENDLTGQLKNKDFVLRQLEAELALAREQLKSASQTNQNIFQQFQEVSKNNQVLQLELASAHKKLEARTQTLKQVEDSLSLAQRSFDQAQLSSQTLDREIEVTKTRLSQIETAYESRLRESNLERDQALRENTKLVGLLAKLEKQNLDYRQQVQEIHGQRQAAQTELKSQEHVLDLLKFMLQNNTFSYEAESKELRAIRSWMAKAASK